MNNNSVPGWGEMNPNHPNSCTCYLPPDKSVQYHCTNNRMFKEVMWTKENVSFKRTCPYHSAGGGDADGGDSTQFQLDYSDLISSGLQSIVNQAKIQEEQEKEEIIQGLKDEAEKNKKKMKALTRKRDKMNEMIAQLGKLMSNDNQRNKEYDGMIILQAQMNGTNNLYQTPIIPMMLDPFKRFLLCQSWPMTKEQLIQAVDFYLRM